MKIKIKKYKGKPQYGTRAKDFMAGDIINNNGAKFLVIGRKRKHPKTPTELHETEQGDRFVFLYPHPLYPQTANSPHPKTKTCNLDNGVLYGRIEVIV